MIPTRSPGSTPFSRQQPRDARAGLVELRVGDLGVVELERRRPRFSSSSRGISEPNAQRRCGKGPPACYGAWQRATPSPARFLSRALPRLRVSRISRIARATRCRRQGALNVSAVLRQPRRVRCRGRRPQIPGISHPFPVQSRVIPDALAGHDLLVKSPTGSGKSLAFGVPLVERIEAGARRPAALVLVPTRELAGQIVEAISDIAHARALSVAAVYGGVGSSARPSSPRAPTS